MVRGRSLLWGIAAALSLFSGPVLGQGETVTFQNVGSGVYLADDGTGALTGVDAPADAARWVLEPVDDGFSLRIRNVATGAYLQIDDGAPRLGPADPDVPAAMWVRHAEEGGQERLQNVERQDAFLFAEGAAIAAAEIGAASPAGLWMAADATIALEAGSAEQMTVEQQPPVEFTPEPAPQEAAAGDASGVPEVTLFVRNLSDAELDIFVNGPEGDPVHIQSIGPGQQLNQESPPGFIWSIARNEEWMGSWQLTEDPVQVIEFSDPTAGEIK